MTAQHSRAGQRPLRGPLSAAVLLVALLAPPALAQGPMAQLRGQVFRMGSLLPLAGASIVACPQTPAGSASPGSPEPFAKARAVTNSQGRFSLQLPAGTFTVDISAAGYEKLHTVERVTPAQVRSIEYRLLPLPDYRRPFEARVRAARPTAGQQVSVEGEELRTLPGTLGDPFRVIALLPGVASPVPVLPLYAIRGASPGMSGYFLDGMRLPQLFHMFVGGGVVHASLVERIDFLPGAYDVTVGRFAGGVIQAETRPARSDGHHLEAELRLYDTSALIELKLPKDVRLSLSGHYGYPGLILGAISPGVQASYWDYQLRLDWRGLTLQALGSYDSLGIKQVASSVSSQMAFHRVQARVRTSGGPLRAELALVGGIDQMQDFSRQRLSKVFFGFRANGHLAWPRVQLYASVDGELSQFTPQPPGKDPASTRPPVDGGTPPDPFPENVDYGDLAEQRNGMVGSIALQAAVTLLPKRLTLTAGARLDGYQAGSRTLIGFDPRAQLHLHLTRWLDLHAGGGIYQQPPGFPVQLPGVDTFALQLGLQRAVHFAVWEELRLAQGVTLQATGFHNDYANATDTPPILAKSCALPKLSKLSGAAADVIRLADGRAYGMEVLLRRQLGRFSGWIAYTFSRSERHYPCGVRPTDYDQTHVLNVVAQARLPKNVMVSARLYVASGRPDTVPVVTQPEWQERTLRNNYRLPTYVQLDLRLDREWLFRRWALLLFVEVLNVTYSRMTLAVTQPPDMDPPPNWRPGVVGFDWILPSIGVRGRF